MLVDGQIAGTWRARRTGGSVTVPVSLWSPVAPDVRRAIGVQAERLARFRGLRRSSVELDG